MDASAENPATGCRLGPPAPRRRPVRDAARAWNLSSLAGRLTEVSDSGAARSLMAAASLILQAQQRGEPAAWIGFGNSIFFPPDFAEWGIDLEALPVIRVPDALTASRAADQLPRSGAFGLVVLDLKTQTEMRMAVQSRLAALARMHPCGPPLPHPQEKGRALAGGPWCRFMAKEGSRGAPSTASTGKSASSRTSRGLRDGATRSRTVERIACVDVAALPLQLLLRDHPDWKDHPAAVVDRDKAQGTILWVNHRARAMRILPGMRHGAGLAISRYLRADTISHAAIQKAAAALVPRLRRYAAAKACDRIVVFQTPEEEHADVRGGPLERLDFAPDVRGLLDRLGIHTLGGFLDLPASQVRSRLEREAHRLHRLASGDL